MHRGNARRGRSGRGARKTIADVQCMYANCRRLFRTPGALTNHVNTYHRSPTLLGDAGASRRRSPESSPERGGQGERGDDEDSDPDGFAEGFDNPPASPTPEPDPVGSERQLPKGWQRKYHPLLNGRPCDEDGNDLPIGSEPPQRRPVSLGDWAPYEEEVQFRAAHFVFRKDQMSASNITELLEIWALDKLKHNDLAPFANADHLYETIDSTELGDAPWKCLVTEPLATGADAPEWARKLYEIWYRDPEVVAKNMLDNPEFDGLFDTTPYIEIDDKDKRRWSDFMSANFSWRHAVWIPVTLSSSLIASRT
ncbi:hypothetical protein C8F01DRAFT_1094371 [Mycena amicta]|nr:hypothetical protein C8F01DRAFT_1094371 [Mycena amicta]